MDPYARFCHRLAGARAERRAARDPATRRLLERAHVAMRPATFLAVVEVSALLAAAGGLLLGTLLALAAAGAPAAARILLPFVFALVAAGTVWLGAPLWLKNQAVEKAKDIDDALPHAIHSMLSLASAGLPPKEVWRSVARQRVFGALADEAARIHRDVELFATDLIAAMRAAQERTPSKRFQEFLQGIISAAQSGVDLETYLRTRGQQYQHELAEHQRRTIDTMGVLAEAFLVVVVAAPLFLIILLSVMAIDQGRAVIVAGYVLALVFIPLGQVILGALVRSMSPRAWT